MVIHEITRVNQRKFRKETSVLHILTIKTNKQSSQQTTITQLHISQFITTHFHNKPRDKDVKVKRCQEKETSEERESSKEREAKNPRKRTVSRKEEGKWKRDDKSRSWDVKKKCHNKEMRRELTRETEVKRNISKWHVVRFTCPYRHVFFLPPKKVSILWTFRLWFSLVMVGYHVSTTE